MYTPDRRYIKRRGLNIHKIHKQYIIILDSDQPIS